MGSGKRKHRILWNRRPTGMRDAGCIDEIVIDRPSMVHIEQMSEREWWIGIYLNEKGSRRWSGHFACDSKGRMEFTEQDCDIEWATDKSHDDASSTDRTPE